jgi:amino acid permease
MSFFSREELEGGLPARRASTLLFAIEGRTAYLVGQSRRAAARYATKQTSEDQENAFLKALAQGRDLPIQPSIQDLERHAPRWASLVPDNPGIKGAIAGLMAEKYTFTYNSVPRIRQALGLDDEAIKQVYERQRDQPLDSVYKDQIPPRERLRWMWAGLARRLEELPPFWTAFALTLTETVGASILALPIALAGIGPIAGIVLLAVLGLVNVLTMASVSESITRNGNIRYGSSYYGGLVSDYLGGVGTIIFTVALFIFNLFLLSAFYIGIATTLDAATGIPAIAWTAFILLVDLYFLRRESLDATIASALLVGVVNIGLILILILITLPQVQAQNLTYFELRLFDGQTFNTAILALVFGVILTAYNGHTSAANAAKVVLERDPSGRSLILGTVSALLMAGFLYIFWVLAVNGAIAPTVLASTSGTALIPLAEKIGPVIYIFGSIFVVLGMGMGSIHFSLGLFNQVREWLPTVQTAQSKNARGSTSGPESDQKLIFLRRLIESKNGRFALSILPILAIFFLVEWLLLTGRGSFTEMLNFVGIIFVALLTGVFPVLLLAASRRKGDYVPGFFWRFLGHPLVTATLYLFFLFTLLLHGLVIWQEPLPRVLALAVSVMILALPLIVIRRGAFVPRSVVELRLAVSDVGDRVVANVTAVGEQARARVIVNHGKDEQILQWEEGDSLPAARLRSATIELAASDSRELKVWLHRVMPEGHSEAIPAKVVIATEAAEKDIDLTSQDGSAITSFDGEAGRLEIELTNS